MDSVSENGSSAFLYYGLKKKPGSIISGCAASEAESYSYFLIFNPFFSLSPYFDQCAPSAVAPF